MEILLGHYNIVIREFKTCFRNTVFCEIIFMTHTHVVHIFSCMSNYLTIIINTLCCSSLTHLYLVYTYPLFLRHIYSVSSIIPFSVIVPFYVAASPEGLLPCFIYHSLYHTNHLSLLQEQSILRLPGVSVCLVAVLEHFVLHIFD